MRRPVRAKVGQAHGYIDERDRSTALPRNVELPPPFDDSDRSAIVALRDGRADTIQQQRALGWLLFACGDSDPPYRPGKSDDVAFALGRYSIALAIRLVLQTQPRKESR